MSQRPDYGSMEKSAAHRRIDACDTSIHTARIDSKVLDLLCFTLGWYLQVEAHKEHRVYRSLQERPLSCYGRPDDSHVACLDLGVDHWTWQKFNIFQELSIRSQSLIPKIYCTIKKPLNTSLNNVIKSWLWNPLFSRFPFPLKQTDGRPFYWDRINQRCLIVLLPKACDASFSANWCAWPVIGVLCSPLAQCLSPVYPVLHHDCCLCSEMKQC